MSGTHEQWTDAPEEARRLLRAGADPMVPADASVRVLRAVEDTIDAEARPWRRTAAWLGAVALLLAAGSGGAFAVVAGAGGAPDDAGATPRVKAALDVAKELLRVAPRSVTVAGPGREGTPGRSHRPNGGRGAAAVREGGPMATSGGSTAAAAPPADPAAGGQALTYAPLLAGEPPAAATAQPSPPQSPAEPVPPADQSAPSEAMPADREPAPPAAPPTAISPPPPTVVVAAPPRMSPATRSLLIITRHGSSSIAALSQGRLQGTNVSLRIAEDELYGSVRQATVFLQLEQDRGGGTVGDRFSVMKLRPTGDGYGLRAGLPWGRVRVELDERALAWAPGCPSGLRATQPGVYEGTCETGGPTRIMIPEAFAALTPLQRLTILALLLSDKESVILDGIDFRIMRPTH